LAKKETLLVIKRQLFLLKQQLEQMLKHLTGKRLNKCIIFLLAVLIAV
jgi:hypothetical protein